MGDTPHPTHQPAAATIKLIAICAATLTIAAAGTYTTITSYLNQPGEFIPTNTLLTAAGTLAALTATITTIANHHRQTAPRRNLRAVRTRPGEHAEDPRCCLTRSGEDYRVRWEQR